jgi:hypothetical protein
MSLGIEFKHLVEFKIGHVHIPALIDGDPGWLA